MGIDISGNKSYTDEILLKYLSSREIKSGMKKSQSGLWEKKDLAAGIRRYHMGVRLYRDEAIYTGKGE